MSLLLSSLLTFEDEALAPTLLHAPASLARRE
jgi:hypothetical protein